MKSFQTFALVDNNGEAVCYITKDDANHVRINVLGFWGRPLCSVSTDSFNVDDFVGSIAECPGTAVIDCDRQFTVVFVGSAHLSIFHPVAGKVFSVRYTGSKDVTGKVMF